MSKKSQKGSFRKTWSYVFPHFYEYRWRLTGIALMAWLSSAFEPSLALSTKFFINQIILHPEEDRKMLWIIPTGIIGLFVLRGVFDFSSKYLLERLCLRVVRNIQIKLYEHFMFLSLDHYERMSTGEMMSRTVNDVSHMQRIVPMSIDTLEQTFKLIGLAGVCFYQEPYLSLITVLALPLTVYPIQRIGDAMKRYTKKGLSQAAELNNMMQETYSGAKVVKAFAREAKQVVLYRELMERMLKIQYKYAAVKTVISPLLGIIASLGVAPIAYFGTKRILEQAVHNPEILGSFFSYLAAIGLMFNPVRRLGEISGNFQTAYGAAERIRETLEKQSAVNEAPDAVELPPMQHEIRYENVSFKYDQCLVLRDFSLVAKKGELVALVGESGAGKTTVVNLLPRFYDVTSGRILIDGTDIRRATLKSLRLQIGVVTQETFLFNDTVMNNILYGSEERTEEEVFQAAQAANAHDFISRLPQGYHTVIGERGVRLSGGEKQRLAIARALIKNPPILILDEATSSLDTAAEREVQKALDSLVKNRTTIAIAHRLSTIRHADKIVVLKDGRIVEEGNHQKLMAKNGEYRRLYEMQFFLGDYAGYSAESPPEKCGGES